jgi:hypothetical protein
MCSLNDKGHAHDSERIQPPRLIFRFGFSELGFRASECAFPVRQKILSLTYFTLFSPRKAGIFFGIRSDSEERFAHFDAGR